jgi:hypothetical protein
MGEEHFSNHGAGIGYLPTCSRPFILGIPLTLGLHLSIRLSHSNLIWGLASHEPTTLSTMEKTSVVYYFLSL